MISVVLEMDDVQLSGELYETPAAEAIARHLPIEADLERWGDEYYGTLGFSAGPVPGEQVEVMEVGDLAYWEPGNALCVFFGPTPASHGDEPRAASPVHRVGRVHGDWTKVRGLGQTVKTRLVASMPG